MPAKRAHVMEAEMTPAGAGGRWAAACAALAISAVLISAQPVRAVSARITIQNAKWVVAPGATLSRWASPLPRAGIISPAPANNPHRFYRIASQVFETVRLAARTRCGGRFGP